jgi:hypothetical protein
MSMHESRGSSRIRSLLLAGVLVIPIVDAINCVIDAAAEGAALRAAYYDVGLFTWPAWVVWGLCHAWLGGKALIALLRAPKEGRRVLSGWNPLHGVVAAELLTAHIALIWAAERHVRLGVGFPSQVLIPW